MVFLKRLDSRHNYSQRNQITEVYERSRQHVMKSGSKSYSETDIAGQHIQRSGAASGNGLI